MKKKILLLLTIPVLFFTCKTNEEPFYDSALGSIYVTVKTDGNETTVPDAVIITNPETLIFQTDNSGSVIVEDIELGTYVINAFHPDFGSGGGQVTVKRGEVVGLEVNLQAGVFSNPSVDFLTPTNGVNLDLDGAHEFSVEVFDDNDNPQDISLEWSSSIDGLLSTQSAGSDGIATIIVNDLSEGVHTIQVRAEDQDGFLGGAVVNVTILNLPNSVTLSPLQTNSSGVQLDWTVSDEPNFINYEVYRSLGSSSAFQVLTTINDINTTSYFDSDVSFGEDYYYYIGVTLSGGGQSASNTECLKPYEGASINVATQVEKMIVDPDRPFLYAIDRVNNSLLFIDTDQGLLTKSIGVGSSPTDLDISLDGEKLYIANFGSTQINVVDLNTQEIDFSFFVNTNVGTWDGNPYRLTALSNNRLAYSSEDQWNSVKIVDATTGNHLDAGGSIYQPNVFSNPEGDVLYIAESGSSGSQVIRYNLSGNNLNEVDESNSGSARRNGFISYNGEFIFFRRQKLLANNLQSVLGTFPEEVYTANSDGSIALGEEQYYSGDNFSILGNLPVTSRVMASDPNDNDIFYIYNATTSRIVVFQP